MALVDKLRKAREATVEAGGFVFTIRRPTDIEMIAVRTSGSSASLLPFVIGWAKLDGSLPTELDLGVPGGEPHPLAFDADACADFLSDRSDIFGPVIDRIVDLYTQHVEAREAAAKN